MNLNKTMLIGNLTRDPEIKTIPSGQSVCSFGLATNRKWVGQDGQKQEQVEFHNIVAWGKLAEICAKYLIKGKKIYAEGRLQTRKWQAQDGSEKQRTEIVMENMQMLDRAGSHGQAGPASIPSIQQEEAPQQDNTEDDGGIKVEEIPF